MYLFASEHATRFCTSYSVRIFTASWEKREPRLDQTIVVAMVNLFAVISSDKDQFGSPRKSKSSGGSESLAEGLKELSGEGTKPNESKKRVNTEIQQRGFACGDRPPT